MSPNAPAEVAPAKDRKRRNPPAASASAIEKIFSFKSSQLKHQQSPLLVAREQFLSHTLKQGISIQRLRSVASMLRHVIRLLELNELRVVTRDEVKDAANKWAVDLASTNRNHEANSTVHFKNVALKWLRFHNCLSSGRIRVEPADTYVDEFFEYLQTVKGSARLTSINHRLRARAFLNWVDCKGLNFADITLGDVDEYVLGKFEAQHKPTYVSSICSSLRLFFGYAHTRGWNQAKIAANISRPRTPRFDPKPRGPDWHEVRRLLDHDFGSNSAAIRAAAITSLSAIYALRSSEIVNLKLSDFDWHNNILTVRRLKNGRVQQFPLAAEVGDKVIRYLRDSRPRCKAKTVFVTLNPPYRSMDATSLWVVIASRLKYLGIRSRNNGVHALRHACATRLLHEGTPLPDIADFLGHRNLRSVSIYAKHDLESLRKISQIDLKAFL